MSKRFYLVFGILLVAGLSPALSLDFEASGRYQLESFRPGGAQFKSWTGTFTVQKSDGKWFIRQSPDEVITTTLVMFDGQTVQSLWRNMVVTGSAAAGQLPAAMYTYSNGTAYASTASIRPANCPGSEFPQLLWFAFLSGSVPDTPGGAEVPAPWHSAPSPEARCYRMAVEWPAAKALFPAQVKFTASDELWAKASRDQRGFKPSGPAPFPNGFVAGIYQVMAWTNLDVQGSAVSFPLEFHSDWHFSPKNTGISNVAERYTCTVEAVHLGRRTIAPIELTEPYVSMLDGRFQDAAHPTLTVCYAITSHLWKAADDPALQPVVAAFRRQDEQARRGRFGVGQVAINIDALLETASTRGGLGERVLVAACGFVIAAVILVGACVLWRVIRSRRGLPRRTKPLQPP